MQSPYPPVAEQRCDTCHYYRSVGDGVPFKAELCCRHAPRPGLDQHPARCPSVRWCGEWAPMENN